MFERRDSLHQMESPNVGYRCERHQQKRFKSHAQVL